MFYTYGYFFVQIFKLFFLFFIFLLFVFLALFLMFFWIFCHNLSLFVIMHYLCKIYCSPHPHGIPQLGCYPLNRYQMVSIILKEWDICLGKNTGKLLEDSLVSANQSHKKQLPVYLNKYTGLLFFILIYIKIFIKKGRNLYGNY